MLCPFLSEPITNGELKKAQPCIAKCSLNVEGKCSIRILAEKAVSKEKKD